MRVLIVLQHANFYRNLATVARELHARGHEVVVLHGTNQKQRAFMHRGLDVARREIPGIVIERRPRPKDFVHETLRRGREVVNRAIYLQPHHPAPDRTGEILDSRLPVALRVLMRTRLGRALFGRPWVLDVWRRLELAVPPSASIVRLLERHGADLVLVSPTVWPKRPVEADFIRAARWKGIPTVGFVNSWDNLTSKGTIHVLPDALVVWNEALAQEAVEIHRVPRSLVHVTGAPHLDEFFALEPRLGRGEACARMGFAERPYLVYLCSSPTLIVDERDIVRRLAAGIRQRLSDRSPMLVVRPHPVNGDLWEGFPERGVAVHPPRGDQANSPESWQEYYEQLHWAIGFVGLNTTAFLEAAIADHPCVAIAAPEFYAAQGRTGHFRHLLAGGGLEIAESIEEAIDRLVRISEGQDEKAAERRAFVESFLRPGGIERTVTPALVDMIAELGERRARPRGSPRRHRPPRLPHVRGETQ